MIDGRYIICPLEIEARALLTLAGMDPARVIVSGPGVAVAQGVEVAHGAGATSVVLAGFGAGLAATPLAPPIGAVVDEEGRAFAPTIRVGGRAVRIVGVDRIVLTPAQKASLRARSGAELADTESHHFARACVERGLEFGVVRAVSDGPNDELPEEAANWIDAQGRTLAARVLLDLARRPALIPRLRALARASRHAAAGLRDGVEEAIR